MTTTDTDTDADLVELRRASIKPVVPGLALGAAILPFTLSFRTTSTTTVTVREGADVTTRASTRGLDYVAVGGGALACVIGLFALVKALGVSNRQVMGLSLAALALGVFQILRGTVLLGL